MVYVDSEELKWMPYVKSWIQKINQTILNDEMKEYMLSLFELYVEKGFIFVAKNCSFSLHQANANFF